MTVTQSARPLGPLPITDQRLVEWTTPRLLDGSTGYGWVCGGCGTAFGTVTMDAARRAWFDHRTGCSDYQRARRERDARAAA